MTANGGHGPAALCPFVSRSISRHTWDIPRMKAGRGVVFPVPGIVVMEMLWEAKDNQNEISRPPAKLSRNTKPLTQHGIGAINRRVPPGISDGDPHMALTKYAIVEGVCNELGFSGDPSPRSHHPCLRPSMHPWNLVRKYWCQYLVTSA